jgi:hypothetical protein
LSLLFQRLGALRVGSVGLTSQEAFATGSGT